MSQFELDLFKDEMKKRSEQASHEFGLPERIIEETDVKLWTFHNLFEKGESADWVWFSPTPVYSYDGKLVGSANVSQSDWSADHWEAVCVCDYQTPERLDEDNGRPWFLKPIKKDGRLALQFTVRLP